MAGNGNERIWRLIDANANRAREGLRVIEDTARFILERKDASAALRRMRHDLDELVRAQYSKLLKYRAVETDPGRKNASKPHKTGIPALVAANFKRCEEAFRVLEEYGRVLAPGAVQKVQTLRYKVYQWEKRLQKHLS